MPRIFRSCLLWALCACSTALGSENQAVAGPGGVTVTAPVAGQLMVNWSGDPAAFKVYVFQSAAAGPFTLVAIVLDPSAMPPAPTIYTATQLTGGVQYCYRMQSAYPDGTTSDLGPQGCGTATGSQPPTAVSITMAIPAPLAKASGTNPAAVLQGVAQWLVASTGELAYPVPVQVGDTITSFRVFGNKQSSSGTRLAATLMVVARGIASGSHTDSNQLTAPGPITLQASGFTESVELGNAYLIYADSTTGSALDLWQDAEVTFTRGH